MLKEYLSLLRVRHYLKNILIFVPAFLSGRLLDVDILLSNLNAFVIFCFSASIVYIINDIKDAEHDKHSPTKCGRPIASGKISPSQGCVLATVLAALVLASSFMNGNHVDFIRIPAIYVAINIGYSVSLKKIPLLDVTILMAGYLLRLQYGGVASDIKISTWIFLTMMSASLFMAFGKRKGELVSVGSDGRVSLKSYTEGYLNHAMVISAASCCIFYAMACADEESAMANLGIDMLWSVPLVFILILRWLMDVENGVADGDPINVLLGDKFMLATGALFVVALFFMIYII